MDNSQQIQIVLNALQGLRGCPKCGTRLRFGDLECPHCGNDLEEHLSEWAESLLQQLR